MEEFEQLFAGQKATTGAIAAIKLSDRLLQASRRVVDLNVTWPISGTFLKQQGVTSGALLELGFEIARSNPTVTSGDNPMSEWIETLIEATDTGWKEKGMRSVAGGLSEWFEGFDLGPLLTDLSSDGHNGRWQMPEKLGKAIEYAGRLVMAARAIDDVNLKPEVKKADFLSHLVNLGGAYAGVQNGGPAQGLGIIEPNTLLFDENINFFADILWKGTDMTRGAQELKDYFQLFDAGKNTHENRVAALKFQTDILRAADQSPYLWQSLSEAFLLAPLFVQNNNGPLTVSFTRQGTLNAQSNEYVYTGKHPWERNLTRDEYAEEQRLWALSLVSEQANQIQSIALEFGITPDAIAGAIFWEAIENPYPVWRKLLPQGLVGAIPIASKLGIPGKIHVTQGRGKTVAEKLEDEGRVDPLTKPGDWKERAKRLSDPKWAIRYIGAILDRAADMYENAATEARKRDVRSFNIPRDYVNIRDQAGILGTLYQGGREEERAEAFERRRDSIAGVNTIRILFEKSGTLTSEQQDAVAELHEAITDFGRPRLPNEKMGPWISQYRWWIREYLRLSGVKPFSIDLTEMPELIMNSNGQFVGSGRTVLVPNTSYSRPLVIPVNENLLKRLKEEGKL
jgi:hypothetical protein